MLNEDYGLELAKAAAEGVGKESVNKLTTAVGGMFPFFGVKRRAVNAYINDIENSNLSPEVKMMAIANIQKAYKQLKNQYAIAQKTQELAKQGTDFSSTSSVDDEWLERFMDSAKFVSDEEVQVLWAKALAQEFENPNSAPPSIIRILSEITPRYVKAFQVVCASCILIVKSDTEDTLSPPESYAFIPAPYEYLKDHDITFQVLTELHLLGLIQFDSSIGFTLKFNSSVYPKLHLVYHSDAATVIKYPDKKLPGGTVFLTEAGRSIARFTEQERIPGHFEAVVSFFKAHGVEFSKVPEIHIRENNT